MNKIFVTILVFFTVAITSSADEKAPLVELTGKVELVRPQVFLKIIPAGLVTTIELRGSRVEEIPLDTVVHVRGVVRSGLFLVPAGEISPKPNEWTIWLEVSEVRTFRDMREFWDFILRPKDALLTTEKPNLK